MIVLGLMSGTSADGIDAAIVEIQGAPPDLAIRLIHHQPVPYDPLLREEIFRCFRPEAGSVDRICRLNFALGEAFAAAALKAIADAGFHPTDIDLIGSHGQTIWHAIAAQRSHIQDRPYDSVPSTLQIGESAVIAERTGITTISDFRTRDVAAGGQGAPLVSYVDWLLFSHQSLHRALQNIGGIGNVTFLPAGRPANEHGEPVGVMAFDTGPGNVLIDYGARRATDGRWTYDRNGQLAAQGTTNQELLSELLAHLYLRLRPPKTTGREEFGAQMGEKIWEKGRAMGLSGADIVCTVTVFTVLSITQAYQDYLPHQPAQVILGGGGARNPTLVALLRQHLAPAEVLKMEALGLPSEAKEALAFALLAYETWHNRVGTIPACTGARRASVLGKITPGENYRALVHRFEAKT